MREQEHTMNMLTWEPATNRLLLPEQLVARLSYPEGFYLMARADGLVCIDTDLLREPPQGSVAATVQAPAMHDVDDPTPPHLQLTPEEAQRVRLPPTPCDYHCWVDAGELYAVPVATSVLADTTPPVTGDVAVTLGLRPLEVELLEVLALQHGVRMVDILIAFAADLAAAQSRSFQQDAQLRSGGSDERDHAQQWFVRNVMPASAARMEGIAGPLFMRANAHYGK